MRYVISMVVAMLFAIIATIFLSSPIATAVVSRFTFDSPDDVANLHALVFMTANVVALIVGWMVGWLGASRFKD